MEWSSGENSQDMSLTQGSLKGKVSYYSTGSEVYDLGLNIISELRPRITFPPVWSATQLQSEPSKAPL